MRDILKSQDSYLEFIQEGQKLISTLNCEKAMPKSEIIEKTGIELRRLNELLLLFTENRIIEFISEQRYATKGYKISGHCGVAAYMVLAAMYVLGKHNYNVSEYFSCEENKRKNAEILFLRIFCSIIIFTIEKKREEQALMSLS